MTGDVRGVSGRMLSLTLALVFVAGFSLASLIHLSPRYCDGFDFRQAGGAGWAGSQYAVECVRWSR